MTPRSDWCIAGKRSGTTRIRPESSGGPNAAERLPPVSAANDTAIEIVRRGYVVASCHDDRLPRRAAIAWSAAATPVRLAPCAVEWSLREHASPAKNTGAASTPRQPALPGRHRSRSNSSVSASDRKQFVGKPQGQAAAASVFSGKGGVKRTRHRWRTVEFLCSLFNPPPAIWKHRSILLILCVPNRRIRAAV